MLVVKCLNPEGEYPESILNNIEGVKVLKNHEIAWLENTETDKIQYIIKGSLAQRKALIFMKSIAIQKRKILFHNTMLLGTIVEIGKLISEYRIAKDINTEWYEYNMNKVKLIGLKKKGYRIKHGIDLWHIGANEHVAPVILSLLLDFPVVETDSIFKIIKSETVTMK